MAIHGDKTQGERDFVMDEFRKGRITVMIATDVAARGIGKVTLCLFLLSSSGCRLFRAPHFLRHPLPYVAHDPTLNYILGTPSGRRSVLGEKKRGKS